MLPNKQKGKKPTKPKGKKPKIKDDRRKLPSGIKQARNKNLKY